MRILFSVDRWVLLVEGWPEYGRIVVKNIVVGARLAIGHGAPLVRKLFMLVVLALIVKTGWPVIWR